MKRREASRSSGGESKLVKAEALTALLCLALPVFALPFIALRCRALPWRESPPGSALLRTPHPLCFAVPCVALHLLAIRCGALESKRLGQPSLAKRLAAFQCPAMRCPALPCSALLLSLATRHAHSMNGHGAFQCVALLTNTALVDSLPFDALDGRTIRQRLSPLPQCSAMPLAALRGTSMHLDAIRYGLVRTMKKSD